MTRQIWKNHPKFNSLLARNTGLTFKRGCYHCEVRAQKERTFFPCFNMLPAELRQRQQQLQAAFNDLSGERGIVRAEVVALTNGEQVVRFRHNVRIRPAALRLTLWEEFRELDSEPVLYAFSYHVADEIDVDASKPIFRYECHPDVGDLKPSQRSQNSSSAFRSPYEREPHFHPDRTNREPIRKLHFPFHRAERKTVVFALVNWLRVDLVKRFHRSENTNG